MPTLAVQLAIGDYAKWRPVFDKHKPLRDKVGARQCAEYPAMDDFAFTVNIVAVVRVRASSRANGTAQESRS